MTDLDVLNELLKSSPRVRRMVKAYIVKAYQRGVKAGEKQGRAAVQQEFDELLNRVDRLGHMNGSTGLFKAKWEETKDAAPRFEMPKLTTAAEIDKAVCEFITSKARRDPDATYDDETNHTLAAAMLEYAAEAREQGIDPTRGLVALAELADDPDAIAELTGGAELHKAFDESKHPRDDAGKFISKHELHAARNDPAKAAELRKRVSEKDRDKLEKILSGEVDPGHTKRSEKQEASRQRRGAKSASKQAAKDVLNRIRKNQSVTTDDILDLRDHLSALTVDELRLQRQAFGVGWAGAKIKKDMVARLIDHAWDASGAKRPKKLADKKPRASSLSESLYQYVKDRGGINPEDPAFLSAFSGVSHAVEDGISLGIFNKKSQVGLDALAQEMHNNGYISVPENTHASEYLLDQIRQGAYTRHADLTKQYERAEDAYWQSRSDAESEHTPAEIAEAIRDGEAAGISEAADGNVADGWERTGESAEPEGKVDTSFDFGANEPVSPEDIADMKPDEVEQPKIIPATTGRAAQLNALIRHATTHPEEMTDEFVNKQLAPLRELPKEELSALAKRVTGRGGRTPEQSIEFIRLDLTAVRRLLESQKV